MIIKRKLALFAVLTVLSGLAFYFSTATPAQAAEHHPKIKHAIAALEEAKKELKGAGHDFGGHRADALKECDAAIAQLKLALQYDKQ